MSMTYVFLAGIGNSEAEHWQAIWHRALGGRWVEHADWEHPRASDWVADLDGVLRATGGPKVIVAHSIGCLLAVEWAKRHHDAQIRGSFLVAPPDPCGPCFPTAASGFAPPGDGKPPLPALVVASSTDPYASLRSSQNAAACWGAEIIQVGARGHINLASQLGAWDEGRALLASFVARLEPG
jgi:predicted alpha/beta hydrolase family esterase